MKHDERDNIPQNKPVRQGFENNCIKVKLEQLLPGKAMRKAIKSSKKYKQIATSIKEVGLGFVEYEDFQIIFCVIQGSFYGGLNGCRSHCYHGSNVEPDGTRMPWQAV